MKIEKIEQLWAEDSKIDITDLSGSSAKIDELHYKYSKIMNFARGRLRDAESRRKRLILIKNDYYTGSIAKEELQRNGWEPFRRVVLKTDLDKWLDGDQDLIDINNEIGNYNDIIDYTKSIIQSLKQRSFNIKNIIEDRKFLNGE